MREVAAMVRGIGDGWTSVGEAADVSRWQLEALREVVAAEPAMTPHRRRRRDQLLESIDHALQRQPFGTVARERWERSRAACAREWWRRRSREVTLVRVGRREYVSRDGRFHAGWHVRQGARSCYTVTDRRTGRTMRAFTLAEVREVVKEIAAGGA